MPRQIIEREDTGDVVVLRMAHGKANALDYELCKSLVDTFEKLAQEDDRPVVLTGEGNIFSAGVDLFRVVNEGEAYLDEFYPQLLDAFAKVFDFPRPLVAAVNGHAIAGGCVLACACDYRIMVDGAGRIGVPELLVGVPFPTVALEILRFSVGNAHLQAAVYSGGTFTSDDALKFGFVDESADVDGLLERAIERARHLASIPGRSYVLTKRQLHEPVNARIAARSREDYEAVRAVWMDPATLENIRGYLERTFGKKK